MNKAEKEAWRNYLNSLPEREPTKYGCPQCGEWLKYPEKHKCGGKQ